MTIRLYTVATLIVGGLACAACGDSHQSSTAQDDAVRSGEPSASIGREAQPGSATERLSDGEIASVTTAANTGEVAQANAALPKLTKPEAKEFATMMVDMHTAAQKRQSSVAQEKGLTPQANSVSAKLTQESDEVVEQLGAASPDEIDRLYMEKQVAVHQKVLDTIDAVLIPSAQDPALKQELQTSRGEVATHLERARATLNELGQTNDATR